MADVRRSIALGILAVLIVGAPLAFGLVDDSWQIVACAVLVVGLIILPPRFPTPTKGALTFWLVLIALLIGKELLPATWFGHVSWRTALQENFGLTLPMTHHPEPGRVVQSWLVLLVGIVWFNWVRTVALGGTFARRVGWALLTAGAVLALVCFVMPHHTANGIYGMRPTTGWSGFGPFPNRNHTADFLAMSAVLGLGLMVREFRHGARWLAAFVAGLQLLILLALLASGSRGALIAGTAGLVIFCVFQIIERGGRKTMVTVLAGTLLAASVLLIGGGQVLDRFQSEQEAGISNAGRIEIWKNTLTMVSDAPLFGFGLGTYQWIFPQYQHLSLEGEVVLHPESSWLQMMAEAGGLVTVLVASGLGTMMTRNARELKKSQQGFDLRTAAFSAVAVIILHALWDVPAHRWATAGFGLAALALACPLRDRQAPMRPGAIAAPLLLGALLFSGWRWQMPFWAPSSLESLLPREQRTFSAAGLRDVRSTLDYFPLSPELHYVLGSRLLRVPGEQDEAYQQFRIAVQLKSSSWTLPASVATVLGAESPGMARYFWTLAMDRSGHRREELFILAFEQGQKTGADLQAWESYAEAHPELLLTVAQRLPDADGRAFFEHWWKQRATRADLLPYEQANCARLLPRYGDPTHLSDWQKAQPQLEATQYKAWAGALHGWKDDAAAWALLTPHAPEPDYPEVKTTKPPDLLEAHWLRAPEDMMNAQLLAVGWLKAGQQIAAEHVVISTAQRPDAPNWFLRKAAYLSQRSGRKSEAVAFLLREK